MGVHQKRKIQLSLNLSAKTDTKVRRSAAVGHQTPSSICREIVGLEHQVAKRQRIGISVSDEEIEILKAKFNAPDADNNDLAHLIEAKIEEHFS